MTSTARPAKALPRRAAGRLSRLARWLSHGAVLWACTVLLIIELFSAARYSRTHSDEWSRQQVAAIAGLAAEQAASRLDAVDALLLSLADDLQASNLSRAGGLTEAQRQLVGGLLVRHQPIVPGVTSLTLVDAAGYRLLSSRELVAGSHIDQPAFHLALATGSRHRPIIWSPEGSPGDWPMLQVARRVDDAGGQLGGTLVAEVDLRIALRTFHDSLKLGEGDFIAVRYRGNELLTGHPAEPVIPAAGLGIVPDAVAQGHPEGILRQDEAGNGSQHLIAYHKLSRYPFYVVFGKGQEAAAAHRQSELLGLILATLLAVAVSTAATIGMRRHALATAQLQLVRGHLKDSNRALRAALADMELLAAKDQLTGLCNRRSFDQRLREAVSHRNRHGGTFALLILDLDHFKGINDRHGHLVGDDVLRRFAHALRDRLRQNDVAARWGGEEFAVLADGADLESATRLAEQIRTAVADTTFPRVDMVNVSIGVATHMAGESEDDLLQRTDRALYAAKRLGRNRVVADAGLEK